MVKSHKRAPAPEGVGLRERVADLKARAPRTASAPETCEAARIGLLIEHVGAEIARLGQGGAEETDSAREIRYEQAKDTLDELVRALSFARARSDAGLLAQIVAVADLLDHAVEATWPEEQREAQKCARRCLHSIAALVCSRAGLDRDSHGGDYFFPSRHDHLAALDRPEVAR